MSSQELQAVLVNDELILARPFTLEDGSIQWRNKFGMVIEGAKPVQQCEPKAAPKAKRAPRARKKAAE